MMYPQNCAAADTDARSVSAFSHLRQQLREGSHKQSHILRCHIQMHREAHTSLTTPDLYPALGRQARQLLRAWVQKADVAGPLITRRRGCHLQAQPYERGAQLTAELQHIRA